MFGLVFEDIQLFKIMARCVLGEEIDESSYVVSQKENSIGSSIYNKIRFDIYAEGSKIITADMQNGYPGEPTQPPCILHLPRGGWTKSKEKQVRQAQNVHYIVYIRECSI